MGRKTAYTLYGISDTQQWEDMQYKKVLELKVTLANKRIRTLTLGDLTDSVMRNIVECTSAVKFNTELLRELKDER